MENIAFNLSSFSKKQVGLKIHIINLIKNFSFKNYNKIYIYISADSLRLLDHNIINKLNIVHLPFTSNSKILKLFYEQIFIPIHSYFYKIKLLHSFDYSGPIFYPYKKTITIHDLNYIKNPDTFSFIQRLIRKILYPK